MSSALQFYVTILTRWHTHSLFSHFRTWKHTFNIREKKSPCRPADLFPLRLELSGAWLTLNQAPQLISRHLACASKIIITHKKDAHKKSPTFSARPRLAESSRDEPRESGQCWQWPCLSTVLFTQFFPTTTCCDSISRSVSDGTGGSQSAAAAAAAAAASFCCPPYDNRLLASSRPELNAALGMYSSPYAAAAAASHNYANYFPYSTEPSAIYSTLVGFTAPCMLCWIHFVCVQVTIQSSLLKLSSNRM